MNSNRAFRELKKEAVKHASKPKPTTTFKPENIKKVTLEDHSVKGEVKKTPVQAKVTTKKSTTKHRTRKEELGAHWNRFIKEPAMPGFSHFGFKSRIKTGLKKRLYNKI